MTVDPTPNLLFPSCADCNRIGLYPMPEMLRRMERDTGVAAVRTFLVAYGGREFTARASGAGSRADAGAAEHWMDAHFAGEKVVIPKGPASHSARLAWTIFVRLKEGWSLQRIAGAAGCTIRTVCNRKKLFRETGVLPGAPGSIQPHQETPKC